MTQVLAHLTAQSSAPASSVVAANNRNAAAHPVSDFGQVLSAAGASSTQAQTAAAASTEGSTPAPVLTPKQIQAVRSLMNELKRGDISLEGLNSLLNGIEGAKSFLSDLGISGEMLAQLGLDAEQLQAMGFSKDVLAELGFSEEELVGLGFEATPTMGREGGDVISRTANTASQANSEQSTTTHSSLPAQAVALAYVVTNAQQAPANNLQNTLAQPAHVPQQSQVILSKVGGDVGGNGLPVSTTNQSGGGMPAFLASLLEQGADEGGEQQAALTQALAKMMKPEIKGQTVNMELFQSALRRLSGGSGIDKPAMTADLMGSTLTTSVASAAITNQPGLSMVSSPTLPSLNVQPQVGHAGWDQAMASRVMFMAQNNMQAAKITMNPKHLGPVEVKLSIQNDQVNVSFIAQNGATREALEQAMPRLREMFSSSGLELAKSDVSDGGASQRERMASNEGGEEHGRGHGDGSSSGLLGEDRGSERSISATVLNGVKVGLVDFYA